MRFSNFIPHFHLKLFLATRACLLLLFDLPRRNLVQNVIYMEFYQVLWTHDLGADKKNICCKFASS